MELILLIIAFIILENFVWKSGRGKRVKKNDNTLLQQTMEFQRQTMEREAMEHHQRDMEMQQQMNNNMHNHF
ncbi:hypothetical protein JOC78_001383 [Bacillus ectoiniformans]|uniref:hypothetical protein n=1 Tax=Bacillus ectoiniformans TaxID=1494429 RepID=UPI00195DE623|nr:hypothetical protein [Bacillus ectoiniformans]MBM7648441.1 hypothetical protein [Bacillus ectoiniformans]